MGSLSCESLVRASALSPQDHARVSGRKTKPERLPCNMVLGPTASGSSFTRQRPRHETTGWAMRKGSIPVADTTRECHTAIGQQPTARLDNHYTRLISEATAQTLGPEGCNGFAGRMRGGRGEGQDDETLKRLEWSKNGSHTRHTLQIRKARRAPAKELADAS